VITSLFLQECRDLLDDPQGIKFPDTMLIRAANRQMRGLFRQMVEGNKEYSNFTMGWPAANNAVQVAQTMWEFRMPSWITHVVDVYFATGFTVPENYWSMYKWTSPQNVSLGQVIPKHRTNQQYPHWSWEGNNNTIRLWNYTTCPDIVVRVAVRPPTLFKCVLSAAAASQTVIHLPSQVVYGDFEIEEGSLVNGVIQVTGTNLINSANYGSVRRIIYSTPLGVSGGGRVTDIEVDHEYGSTLSAGDTLETIVPIPDEHTRILVLKTAQVAFQKKNNVDGLRSIANEMQEEWVKFVNYATPPRDSNGPTFIKSTLQNRAPWNQYYPYWGNWSW